MNYDPRPGINSTLERKDAEIERLRSMQQGYRDEAAAYKVENARLRAALRPFADAVFNDNGDMTVSLIADYAPYRKAYFAMRDHQQQVGEPK